LKRRNAVRTPDAPQSSSGHSGKQDQRFAAAIGFNFRKLLKGILFALFVGAIHLISTWAIPAESQTNARLNTATNLVANEANRDTDH